ncbi:mavicyanin-like [Brachypodium distachyon]|uniref:Phytocyanin domain-containing protein n=1 Tax=Brachypodium distachyon TaxID=15368 RepID=A0A0Q3JSW5_BRADI|nr:mavicyanin-like [Brachypodium distachyon]KQK20739.1 hypothetical protein BRADI_1g56552v3 [Brachypodium distachyon]|eukprot:XP_024313351.1 mavicyanin-like [Brachypodium distachyon]
MASRQVLLMAAAAIAVAAAILPAPASAEVFKVGDDALWTLGYPAAWTNGKTFAVGDSLKFVYPAGKHTVVEVTGQGFKECNTNGNLGSWGSGSDTIKLDKTGRRWFICGVGNHCEKGMKLLVTVAGANDKSSPATSLKYNVGAGATALAAGAAAVLML